MRAIILAITASLALAAATPASAGTVQCFWEALPQATRDSQLAQANAGLTGTRRGEQRAPADETARAAQACGLDHPTSLPTVVEAYAVELAAGRWLQAHAGVTPERLDAAWAAIVIDYRTVWSITDQAAQQDALVRILITFIRTAGIDVSGDDEVRDDAITAYVVARGTRDETEAGRPVS